MIEWHTECRTDDEKIIDWGKNERYFWVTSIFYFHSRLIPSFFMRKDEKNQIPPTRDQKIVTLDWMNLILNDGLREPRGRILNKGQPLRFFFILIPPSFHCFLIIQYSFSISDDIRISATFDSPQPPLQRGLGGVNWRTHSTLILLTEWEWNDSTTLDQMTLYNLTLIQFLGWD